MKTIFTTEFIKSHCGCYRNTEGKLQRVYEENKKTCFNEKTCDVTIEEILSSNIPTKDKYWFVANNVLINREEKQTIAILALGLFLDAFVKDVPEDKEYAEKYITIAKDYVNDKASYSQLRTAWIDARNSSSAHGGWVLDDVDCFCTAAHLGSGFSDPYYLLAYLHDYAKTSELLFNAVKEFTAK
jgi:hypothetical protein